MPVRDELAESVKARVGRALGGMAKATHDARGRDAGRPGCFTRKVCVMQTADTCSASEIVCCRAVCRESGKHGSEGAVGKAFPFGEAAHWPSTLPFGTTMS